MSGLTSIKSTGWTPVAKATPDLVGKFSWITDNREEPARRYKGTIDRIEGDSVVISGSLADAVNAEKQELSFPVNDAQVEVTVLSSGN